MKYLLIILSLFLIGCDDEDSGNSNINVEEYFSHNDSNQVAFYFFGTVLIDGVPLDSTDWVAAFKGDVCVGSQQWTCEGSCDVPVCGQYIINGETYNEGYMEDGEYPSFKIYDASDNIYYDAIPSTQIPWYDALLAQIDTLNAQID